MGIFERISNGWNLAIDSFYIVKENKKLLIFPILSTISLLLILGSFIGGIHTKWGIDIDSLKKIDAATRYFLLFIFYFINYAVIIFFNMGLIHCTLKILNGAKATVKDGIVFSLSKLGLVLSWALLSATVGVVLKIIEDKNEKIGSFIADLFGALWSIATFFVVPVMAYENLSVFQAIKRSSSLLKNTWGERIGANFTFFVIGLIISILVGLPLGFLAITLSLPTCIIVVTSIVLIVSCIISAAETVFIAAAYQYAAGTPVGGFNRVGFSDIFV